MSNLTERCEQRKAEAEALAEKFNALTEEGKKIKGYKLKLSLISKMLNTQNYFLKLKKRKNQRL